MFQKFLFAATLVVASVFAPLFVTSASAQCASGCGGYATQTVYHKQIVGYRYVRKPVYRRYASRRVVRAAPVIQQPVCPSAQAVYVPPPAPTCGTCGAARYSVRTAATGALDQSSLAAFNASCSMSGGTPTTNPATGRPSCRQ